MDKRLVVLALAAFIGTGAVILWALIVVFFVTLLVLLSFGSTPRGAVRRTGW
jgi:hypothetical protein